MKGKAIFFIFIISLMGLITASCRTGEFGSAAIDIHGMVYDFSNRPVAHCEISLGKRYNTVTDINGRFTLSKIPSGIHTLTASKNGFENFINEITVMDPGQIIYIRIPSQNQLLNLVDEALSVHNLGLAADLTERAYQIDKNNIEALFYYATVKFRQSEYQEAIEFLEIVKNLGSRDLFVDRFLSILRRLQNAENSN